MKVTAARRNVKRKVRRVKNKNVKTNNLISRSKKQERNKKKNRKTVVNVVSNYKMRSNNKSGNNKVKNSIPDKYALKKEPNINKTIDKKPRLVPDVGNNVIASNNVPNNNCSGNKRKRKPRQKEENLQNCGDDKSYNMEGHFVHKKRKLEINSPSVKKKELKNIEAAKPSSKDVCLDSKSSRISSSKMILSQPRRRGRPRKSCQLGRPGGSRKLRSLGRPRGARKAGRPRRRVSRGSRGSRGRRGKPGKPSNVAKKSKISKNNNCDLTRNATKKRTRTSNYNQKKNAFNKNLPTKKDEVIKLLDGAKIILNLISTVSHTSTFFKDIGEIANFYAEFHNQFYNSFKIMTDIQFEQLCYHYLIYSPFSNRMRFGDLSFNIEQRRSILQHIFTIMRAKALNSSKTIESNTP